MKQSLTAVLVLFLTIACASAGAGEDFDKFFSDKTMRVDYYHLGDAASEIVTNIITHACRERSGDLRVQLTLSSNSLQIDSYDDGDPFDIDQTAVPEPDEVQEGGYGLFVVRQIIDELEYQPATPEGNHWRLVKSAA